MRDKIRVSTKFMNLCFKDYARRSPMIQAFVDSQVKDLKSDIDFPAMLPKYYEDSRLVNGAREDTIVIYFLDRLLPDQSNEIDVKSDMELAANDFHTYYINGNRKYGFNFKDGTMSPISFEEHNVAGIKLTVTVSIPYTTKLFDIPIEDGQ